MKFLKIATLALSSALALNATSATIYDGDNLNGRYRTLSPSASSFDNNLDTHGLGGRVSSVKVNAGECVLLANQLNFGGEYKILSPGNHRLADLNYDNQATGWMVYRPKPASGIFGSTCQSSVGWFYQHGGGGGWRYPAPYGIKNSDIWTFNDHASSATVPSGMCLVAFQHGGFSGTQEAFPPGTTLPFRYLNDQMSGYYSVGQYDSECYTAID